jgi:hypothetical protein
LHAEVTKAPDAKHRDKIAGAFRSALNVVSPAQSSGAASAEERSFGIDTRPLALAIIIPA